MSEVKETKQSKRTSSRKRAEVDYKEPATHSKTFGRKKRPRMYQIKTHATSSKRPKTHASKPKTTQAQTQETMSSATIKSSLQSEESVQPNVLDYVYDPEHVIHVSTMFGGIPADLQGILGPPPPAYNPR